jgi:hypothetical protein
MLTKIQRRTFSFYHNLHSPPQFYVNGIKYIQDYDLDEYESTIKALLTKRQPVKREIPAKIAILDDLGSEYKSIYH